MTLNALPLHLKFYTGEYIAVISEMIMQVQYGSEAKELGLNVVQEKVQVCLDITGWNISNFIGKLLD